MSSLYFNAKELPSPRNEYVAWVDVMGASVSMSRSLSNSANFILKLHIAALRARKENVLLYPVMDGYYASSSRQADILNFLSKVFEEVADEFNETGRGDHQFIIRGALAFGPVVHGREIRKGASYTLTDEESYRDAILLGHPMVQAYTSERLAPPFGIYVHESARAFSPPEANPLPYIWWRWANPKNSSTWRALGEKLKEYFKWCDERAESIAYCRARLEVHRDLAAQYFIQGTSD